MIDRFREVREWALMHKPGPLEAESLLMEVLYHGNVWTVQMVDCITPF